MTESTEAGEATGGLPAALRACVYERQTDGRWRCGRCGDTTRRPSERPPRRSCPTMRQDQGALQDQASYWVQAVAQVAASDENGLGLGDLTAAGLSAIGITKERVERWFGECGCCDRQEWLNKFGHKIRSFLGGQRDESAP